MKHKFNKAQYKNFLKTIILFTIIIISQTSFSQVLTNKGTDFWIGFLPGAYTRDSMLRIIVITDNKSANIVINNPLNNWTEKHIIAANSSKTIYIPNIYGLVSFESEKRESKAIHLTSNVDVAVYAFYIHTASSGGASILPSKMLDNKYFVMSYNKDNSSDFVIVATKNNTNILFTPRGKPAKTFSGPLTRENVPWDIKLDSGETYHYQYSNTTTSDTIITIIEQDPADTSCKKNFAVFAGNNMAYVPSNPYLWAQILYEQMISTKYWGNKYITVPSMTKKKGDVFKIVAAENNTTVKINGGKTFKLNKGICKDTFLLTASYIEADKPIMTTYFATGSTYDSVPKSDPFMILMNDISQFTNNVNFNVFYTARIDTFFTNIVTKTLNIDNVYLDGNKIYNYFKTVTSNPEYSYAQIPIKEGNHTIKSDGGFLANVYAFGLADAYGFSAGGTYINQEIGFGIVNGSDTISYYNFSKNLCNTAATKFAVKAKIKTDVNFWDFGDGSPTDTNKNVSHLYKNAGKYNLKYIYREKGKCEGDTIFKEITVDNCVGVYEYIKYNTSIYPNPTNEDFNYIANLPIGDKGYLEITDNLGKLISIYDVYAGANRLKISSVNYKAGIYYSKLVTEKGYIKLDKISVMK